MDIIDLDAGYETTYCKCLEEWSGELEEAGELKKQWLERKRPQGLRVKLAKNEKGEIVGMIHYIPVEHAPVVGKDLYYVYCVWVHGYKQGVGNHQKKGIGSALLEAAEQDARALGAKGIAAWGVTLPFFMRSSWFKKRGYARADRDGMMELVWKPFTDGAEAPRLIKQRKKPSSEKGLVTVTCFRNGWCPAQNMACERMKRAAGECGSSVRYTEIDTDTPEALNEWGIADAIFIDDKQVVTGPPPSFASLQRKLKARMRRVRA